MLLVARLWPSDAVTSVTCRFPAGARLAETRSVAIPFRPLGPEHLVTLAVVAAVGLALLAAARRAAPTGARRLRWLLAGALAGAHATETVLALGQGWYRSDMLPLQLCDLAALLAVYGLLTRDRRAVEPLYFFALSATLPALLATELDVGFPHFRYVIYFVEHGLTVIAALVLVAGLRLRPGPGAWWRAFGQVNALAAVAAVANLGLGTNFFYLREKPAGATPFDWFGPWPFYLVVLELLVLLLFRLLDLALGRAASPAPSGPARS